MPRGLRRPRLGRGWALEVTDVCAVPSSARTEARRSSSAKSASIARSYYCSVQRQHTRDFRFQFGRPRPAGARSSEF
eukprot:4031913-Pyramimonas_sp.AAC.1